jgi:hypothetical protein
VLLALLLLAAPADSAVWQYSVPVGKDALRRAYLWIPENCAYMRGVIIGVQNMLEQPMFEDPTIRLTAAEAGLAIVWISPGDDLGDKNSPYHRFNPPSEIVAGIQDILTRLAAESGYAEIQDAPLMATAHSAATPFVWGMDYYFDAARMIAIFPCKGWFTGHIKPGIPVFHTGSEYGEVGGTNWGETYLKDRIELRRLRGEGTNCLLGEFVDIGAGHFEWNPEAAKIIALFIRKAAQYRLPENPPVTGPVVLRPVAPESGWLIDPEKLGTPAGQPVAYAAWAGDPTRAFWYFDREMAQAVNDYMVAGLAKKPQVIDFVDEQGKPVSLAKGGMADLHPTLLEDGATFKVAATFLDQSPTPRLYHGEAVGHAAGPILFKVSTGALKQTGPDTFRIWMGRGGLVQQGSPWEPWIMACQEGDTDYRRADRPGHPWFHTLNSEGNPQTIDFPKIADQPAEVKLLKLSARSDAGLPVQFYVVSGPVELKDDDTLVFHPPPPRAKYPLRVIVGAYQWGRITGEKVRTAGPVFQEFFIKQPTSN